MPKITLNFSDEAYEVFKRMQGDFPQETVLIDALRLYKSCRDFVEEGFEVKVTATKKYRKLLGLIVERKERELILSDILTYKSMEDLFS